MFENATTIISTQTYETNKGNIHHAALQKVLQIYLKLYNEFQLTEFTFYVSYEVHLSEYKILPAYIIICL